MANQNVLAMIVWLIIIFFIARTIIKKSKDGSPSIRNTTKIGINIATPIKQFDKINIISEMEHLYLESLQPCLYDDFKKLDKFEKLTKFTIKLLDIETIELVLKNYLLSDIRYSALNKEKRAYIKSFGYNSYTLYEATWHYSRLAYNVALYFTQIYCNNSKFWTFKVPNTENKNRKLHKKFLKANDEFFSIYYPPNFWMDDSQVRALSDDFLRITDDYEELQRDIKPTLHRDFDFNVPKYILENILPKDKLDFLIKYAQTNNLIIF